MASGVEIHMKGGDRLPLPSEEPAECSSEQTDPRKDLVHRVLSSSTFEKSPKLRAFLLYVCQCALNNHPAAATEQQIGIHVFGRPPGYNPNDDNIVRSQARLLRLKLEHHFANEGVGEPFIITIPKGRYLPAFERRLEHVAVQHSQAATDLPVSSPVVNSSIRRNRNFAIIVVSLSIVLVLAVVWIMTTAVRAHEASPTRSANLASERQAEVPVPHEAVRVATLPVAGEVRIAAGNMGAPSVDIWGRVWGTDEFYQGGVSRPGPKQFFPPVSDPGPFRTIREGAAADTLSPQEQSKFRYDIPVPPGVYELKLYFADPVRYSAAESDQDSQNLRHFQVNVNGRPLLTGFDAVADGGPSAVDIRAFKDVTPAGDGKVHLEFLPAAERPFVSAIELTPGAAGKIKPIRISAQKSDFTDSDGTKWSGDTYFVNGHTSAYTSPESSPQIPGLYSVERFGNFTYEIPVPAGSYTLKLHFMESFFGPTVPSGLCRGPGCRVFDVACNGAILLKDFDIYQAAGGAFRPVIRTFHKLHPNGQGKLLISFSPSVNYAEVRAIEVIDEAQ